MAMVMPASMVQLHGVPTMSELTSGASLYSSTEAKGPEADAAA